MTITTNQVKLLMKKLKKYNQETAAAKAGMDVKTARKYIKSKRLPSDMRKVYQTELESCYFAQMRRYISDSKPAKPTKQNVKNKKIS